MPNGSKNSIVDVKEDAPPVVAGKVDEIAENQNVSVGETVTIKLTVEKQEDAEEQEKIKQTAETDKKVDTFLDLTLTKTVTDHDGNESVPEVITNTEDVKGSSTEAVVLEIVIPYDFSGKKNITVYRHHGSSSAEKLTEASTKAEGTFTLDIANGLIHIYAAKFSTYAIGYDPSSVPVTGVTLNKTILALTAGGTETLTATVAPSDAANKAVAWTSSNSSVATVDTNGKVTAVSAGTATITVTTEDGGKTAACTVTVTTGGSTPTPTPPSGGGSGGWRPSDPDPAPGPGTGTGTGTGTGPATITVPVSGSENTVNVSASVTGSTATVQKPTAAELEKVIGKGVHTGSVTVNVSGLGTPINEVNIPYRTVQEINTAASDVNNDVTGLTFVLSTATVTVDAAALNALTTAAGNNDLVLHVDETGAAAMNAAQKQAVAALSNPKIVDAYFTAGGKRLTDFGGGTAIVRIPYAPPAGMRASNVQVYYVDETGALTAMEMLGYDAVEKTASFNAPHFSYYVVSADLTRLGGVADPDATGVSAFLNTDDHIGYVNGYGTGSFGPDDEMTRAQAAQLFYNLLRDQDGAAGEPFDDVPETAWYARAVSVMRGLGIIDGVGGNSFEPDRRITRAEFTVLAMRFAVLAEGGENKFPDVNEDQWFYAWVVGAVQYGWITGFPDGTFKPYDLIGRAEVVTLVNHMLGRSADVEYIDAHLDELRRFPDVDDKKYWAYYDIMEAANPHKFKKDGDGEDWTG